MFFISCLILSTVGLESCLVPKNNLQLSRLWASSDSSSLMVTVEETLGGKAKM